MLHANHTLGFLYTVVENPPRNVEEMARYRHALGYGNPGKSLEFDDYLLLEYAPNEESFLYLCKEMLPKYERIWSILGKPENAFQWYEIRWNRKHDKHPKTRRMYDLKNAERVNISAIVQEKTGINFNVFTYHGCRDLKVEEWHKILEGGLSE